MPNYSGKLLTSNSSLYPILNQQPTVNSLGSSSSLFQGYSVNGSVFVEVPLLSIPVDPLGVHSADIFAGFSAVISPNIVEHVPAFTLPSSSHTYPVETTNGWVENIGAVLNSTSTTLSVFNTYGWVENIGAILTSSSILGHAPVNYGWVENITSSLPSTGSLFSASVLTGVLINARLFTSNSVLLSGSAGYGYTEGVGLLATSSTLYKPTILAGSTNNSVTFSASSSFYVGMPIQGPVNAHTLSSSSTILAASYGLGYTFFSNTLPATSYFNFVPTYVDPLVYTGSLSYHQRILYTQSFDLYRQVRSESRDAVYLLEKTNVPCFMFTTANLDSIDSGIAQIKEESIFVYNKLDFPSDVYLKGEDVILIHTNNLDNGTFYQVRGASKTRSNYNIRVPNKNQVYLNPINDPVIINSLQQYGLEF